MIKLNIGILTWNPQGFSSNQLINAALRRGIEVTILNFNQLVACVKRKPYVLFDGEDLAEKIDALIVRPIGRGSLEEIIFRMNLLRKLERIGVKVINPPEAIERSVDKYHTLTLLEEAGIPVPKTMVTENSYEALRAFHELGGDVVVKPLFGSRGFGVMRISNPDEAIRIFRNLAFNHEVIYIQEFIHHGNWDIRTLVLGKGILASERRVSDHWKTNISQGARPTPIKLDDEIEELAIRSAEVIGCEVAGIDILDGPEGPVVIELNSQPGWKGLQEITPINIGEAIIDYVLKSLKRG